MQMRPVLAIIALIAFCLPPLAANAEVTPADSAIKAVMWDLDRFEKEVRKLGPKRKAQFKRINQLLRLTERRLQGSNNKDHPSWVEAAARLETLRKVLAARIAGKPVPSTQTRAKVPPGQAKKAKDAAKTETQPTAKAPTQVKPAAALATESQESKPAPASEPAVEKLDVFHDIGVAEAAIRERPEPEAKAVGRAVMGEQVHVVGRLESGWVQVAREGVAVGWLHDSALRRAAAAPAPTPAKVAVALPPDIAFGRFHALVIGNNEYQHLPKLASAVADAKAVAGVLEGTYGFDVTLLLNATRSDILRAINDLRAELTEEDNLLIYYAGHGTLDRGV